MPTKKLYSKKNNKIFQKLKCLTHKKKTYKRMTGGSSSSSGSGSLYKIKTKTEIANILRNKSINPLLTNLKDKIAKMYTYLQKMYDILLELYNEFIEAIIEQIVQTIIEDVCWTIRLKSQIDFAIIDYTFTDPKPEFSKSAATYFNNNKGKDARFGQKTLNSTDDNDASKCDALINVLEYSEYIYKFDYLYTSDTHAKFTDLRDQITVIMKTQVENDMMKLLSFYKNSADLKKNLIITKLELLTLLLDFTPNQSIDKCKIYVSLNNIITDYI